MPLDEPGWWYGAVRDGAPRVLVRLLLPLARVYGGRVERRFHSEQPYRSRFPVICVGNFTAGGTGKTPLAILIAKLMSARGGSPVFLTRGYGGHERGPVWVEESANAAWRFGDEPLLLARVAPTVVSRDRRLGVQMIENSGHSVTAVIMDDGLQNPAIAKDLSIAVVDGMRGLGNGEVIPAGPLRAPIEFQLGLVDAIVVRDPQPAGDGEAPDIHARLKRSFPGPVLAVHTKVDDVTDWLSGAPVVAFAGIANPDRFFSLLKALGAHVAHCIAFRDHQMLSRRDARRLLKLAQQEGARLVTTEKDWVRLHGTPRLPQAFVELARPLAIKLKIEERDLERLVSLIEAVVHLGYPRPRKRPPQI